MTPPSLEAAARGRATAAANRRAAQKRVKPPLERDPATLEEVRILASWAAFNLATGHLDPERARGIAQLCNTLAKVFVADQSEKLRELEQIVRKLQADDAARARAER